jgi:cytochrome P450 family 9
MFNFKQPAYVIIDSELVKQICIKDFDHFVNHNDATTTGVDKVFDRTLFSLHNNEWRDMRTTLSPIFTSSKMKMMFGLLSDQAVDFTNFFEERAKNGEKLDVDVLDIFARFTADGISTAVLGFEADCVRNKDSFVYKTAQKLLDDFTGPIGNIKFTLAFILPKLYKALGIQLMSDEIRDFFRRVVVDVMKERDEKNISRPDVIQLLLQAKKGQLKNETDNEKDLVNFAANIEYNSSSTAKSASHFTDNDWIAQGFIFFGAG